MVTSPDLRDSRPPRSLYAHFPFCWHRCHYCDFSVKRSRHPPIEEWLEAIDADIEDWFTRTAWRGPVEIETLFVGGGTPSLLGPEGMSGLRELLSRRFRWSLQDIEWTAESNPASLDTGLAEAWLETGVNRLSVGVQSFDDGVLRWLGRLHDSAGARRSLAAVVRAGFTNINLDLIFGLPADLRRDWRSEIDIALEAGVTHVSAYGLTAEPRTPLGRRVAAGSVRMVGDEAYAREYLDAAEELERAGFVHYEVSNFALPGRECRHNWHYWDGSPYLGIGPSAHSFVDRTRVWNVYGWEAYRNRLRKGRSPREGFEVTGAGESRLERLWLAFRTKEGVRKADPLTGELMRVAGDLLDRWEVAGWLAGGAEGLRMTPSGWLRMDELVAALGARLGQ